MRQPPADPRAGPRDTGEIGASPQVNNLRTSTSRLVGNATTDERERRKASPLNAPLLAVKRTEARSAVEGCIRPAGPNQPRDSRLFVRLSTGIPPVIHRLPLSGKTDRSTRRARLINPPRIGRFPLRRLGRPEPRPAACAAASISELRPADAGRLWVSLCIGFVRPLARRSRNLATRACALRPLFRRTRWWTRPEYPDRPTDR